MNFDISTALLCAESSSLAYQSTTVESALAHVLVRELPDVRIVAFRGTNNPMDWLTDARVKLEEYPGISGFYVHSGFLASMLSVRDALINELKSLPPKKTIVTGHSKGAAEARLFLTGHYIANIVPGFTFGEPRSMSRQAAKIADTLPETGLRVIHEEDFVARIPWMCGRYRHAGQEVFLPSFGGYIVNPSMLLKLGSDAYGLARAWTARHVIGLCDDTLKDHFIANYLAAIRAFNPAPSLSGVSA